MCPIPQTNLSSAIAGCSTEPVSCLGEAPGCVANTTALVGYTQLDVTTAPSNGYSAFIYLPPTALSVPGTTKLKAFSWFSLSPVSITCVGSQYQALVGLQKNAPSNFTQDLGTACEFNAVAGNNASFLTIRDLGVPIGTYLKLGLSNDAVCPPAGGGAGAGIAIGVVFAVIFLSAVLAGVRQVQVKKKKPSSEASAVPPRPEAEMNVESNPRWWDGDSRTKND
jgi:hypothetical protein